MANTDNKKNYIIIGDRIDIALGEATTYRSMVENLFEHGRAVIAAPTYKGLNVILHMEDVLTIYYYRENGRFKVEAAVESFETENNVNLVIIKFTSEPEKQQRRSAFRLRTNCDILFKRVFSAAGSSSDAAEEEEEKGDGADDEIAVYAEKEIIKIAEAGKIIDEEEIKCVSEDISETGIRLRSPVFLETDDIIHMKVFLKYPRENSPPLLLGGKICQVQPLGNVRKIYMAGVEFIGVSDEYRRVIAKFVFVRQQQFLRTSKDR
jgi:c-di-GMP-binding flagellar brake protein YcgR